MCSLVILFGIGAFSYGLIEILWRGHTHWSMLIAGGICLVLFSGIGKTMKKSPLLYRCMLGGIAVTAVEFVFGVIFNLILRKNIWDYSKIPFNLGGQVCLLYTVLWSFLSIVAIPLSVKLDNKIKNPSS
ncbi:MAG: hypothetical protein IJP21_04860 [Clostridia bacterium]|nr:hypothetical protein [Clostridia bacterium]